MFDFPQPGVGNSGALCEVVRSLRPKTAPFFADPWQQICGNDIVSCWVITHNSDCHILQSPGGKNGGTRGEKKIEKRITLKYWRKMTGEMSSTWSAILKKNSLLQETATRTTVLFYISTSDVVQNTTAPVSCRRWFAHANVQLQTVLFSFIMGRSSTVQRLNG